ncbi:hypothetical protein E2C01_068739 [Portunus trituberculatus]|uniref:Uncharacterized protein n=1 Tax=Portunus trituberculatus TaxID=210409 RepID=A0A5B7HN67_PORTR|nr:hypothetical protein [Portunus trituberculatus]
MRRGRVTLVSRNSGLAAALPGATSPSLTLPRTHSLTRSRPFTTPAARPPPVPNTPASVSRSCSTSSYPPSLLVLT